MQVTVLVNEAVLRLIRMLNGEAQKFPETKEHLMNLLTQMMRFTLTDYARLRPRFRLGAGRPRRRARRRTL